MREIIIPYCRLSPLAILRGYLRFWIWRALIYLANVVEAFADFPWRAFAREFAAFIFWMAFGAMLMLIVAGLA